MPPVYARRFEWCRGGSIWERPLRILGSGSEDGVDYVARKRGLRQAGCLESNLAKDAPTAQAFDEAGNEARPCRLGFMVQSAGDRL